MIDSLWMICGEYIYIYNAILNSIHNTKWRKWRKIRTQRHYPVVHWSTVQWATRERYWTRVMGNQMSFGKGTSRSAMADGEQTNDDQVETCPCWPVVCSTRGHSRAKAQLRMTSSLLGLPSTGQCCIAAQLGQLKVCVWFRVLGRLAVI